jgi:hypothetical protein
MSRNLIWGLVVGVDFGWVVIGRDGPVFKNKLFEYRYALRRSHTINEQRHLCAPEFYLRLHLGAYPA